MYSHIVYMYMYKYNSTCHKLEGVCAKGVLPFRAEERHNNIAIGSNRRGQGGMMGGKDIQIIYLRRNTE